MDAHQRISIGVGLLAALLHVAALGTYLWWVFSGDWLFGHYHGPRHLVVTARFLAVLACILELGWLVHAFRAARVNLAILILLLLLSVPSGLITVEWLVELNPPGPSARPAPPRPVNKPAKPVDRPAP